MEFQHEIKIANYKVNLKRKLGSGAFGDIFHGVNSKTNEEVAVKIESTKLKNLQLQNETRILKYLQGGPGIPNVHHYMSTPHYNFMIIELLGPSLEDLHAFSKRSYDLKTVLLLAEQMINRLEYIHSRHMLHRDIKPDNFLLGQKRNRHLIYLIDFGLAKRFRNPRNGEHIEYIDGKSFTGTARYASIYTHLGIEQGRRDDLESLGYNLLYFLRGNLPWQGIKVKSNKEKYKRILDIKMNLSSKKLCENYPQEFCIFVEYSRALQFEEKPDYEYIRSLFSRLFLRFQFEKDYIYKWNTFMINYESNDLEKRENEV